MAETPTYKFVVDTYWTLQSSNSNQRSGPLTVTVYATSAEDAIQKAKAIAKGMPHNNGHNYLEASPVSAEEQQ